MSVTYADLENKNILMTGASRGIGRTLALELAKQKAHIIFTTRKKDENSQELINKINSLGGKATHLCFDLTDYDEVKNQVNSCLKDLGVLHGLINNAGMSKDQLILRMKPEDIQRTLEVNLSSAIFLTSVASRYLMKANGASVINISSIVGLMGNAGQSVYAASKAGLIGFTKSLAKELASRKVRSNAICPGFIQSDMTDQLPEETKEKYLEAIALNEFGTAKDIANLVTFLLSNQARYMTGESFKIDGGLYI